MARPSKFRKVYYTWETVPIVLTVKETAEILKCSTATVQSYIRLGELAAAKHGNKFFVTKESLQNFMNAKFIAAAGGVCA